MALDLAKNHNVSVADISEESLAVTKSENPDIKVNQMDLKDSGQISAFVSDSDLVICAVPGSMGFETLKTLIHEKKTIVDISFFPENSLDLDNLAQKNGVTAAVDCGVAPGMDNILLGYWDLEMEVKDFECLVGGLPVEKKWPFNYKAPFSPSDVIEEYVRPARLMEDGKVVTRPALSEVEIINFPDIGELEAFNSDGLRTLLDTMSHIPNMKEKTLRYPSHAQNIMVLKESGFFSTKPIEIDGKTITPIDFTSNVLFKDWQLEVDDKEFTAMRIRIQGIENGSERTITYHLLDRYDEETRLSSMSRTTGYTATAVANLILEGKFDKRGIIPPELIGASGKENVDYILSYLEERNIHYRRSED